jgi:HlyD family secretion protein
VKTAITLSIGVVLGSVTIWFADRRPMGTDQAVTAPPPHQVLAAAQGRVEGRTENIEVEASIDGLLQSLLVIAGQKVAKDQVIGRIACENLDSEVRALEASYESARQARVRLLRGSRDEERSVAEQDVASAQAVLEQARRQNDRMQFLVAKDDVSRQTADGATRDLSMAEALLRSAMEKQKLANAGPLPEEVAKADADVAAAEERLHAAVAQRDKCVIRAPISGTITRLNMRAGETFSTVMPRPIATMADLSECRIRAEVDERDLPSVEINRRVRISSLGGREPFGGKVIWTSLIMGRRTARSTDPADRSDRDILETLIAPDRGVPNLPIGLRVTVEFLEK